MKRFRTTTVHDALAAAGWSSNRKGRWRLPGRKSPTLSSIGSFEWLRIISSPVVREHAVQEPVFLSEAAAPDGPFKLIPHHDDPRRVLVVADVPLGSSHDRGVRRGSSPLPQGFLDVSEDAPFESTDAGTESLLEWARDLSRAVGLPEAAAPSPERHSAELSPEGLLERLRQGGFACTRAGDVVHVQFEGRRSFAQADLQSTRRGLRVDVELCDVRGWKATSRRALERVAALANERLRLVRIVRRTGEDADRVYAQVHLGTVSGPEPWLEVALDALRAAATLLVREVPLLSDTQLAEWILQRPLLTAAKPTGGAS